MPKTHHHKHGPRDMADGKIKDVRCHGPRLEMEFETSGHLLYLRTGNYFVIGFSAINYTSSKEWNPCKGLKGRYARVRFYDIKGHPDQGDLISLALRK